MIIRIWVVLCLFVLGSLSSLTQDEMQTLTATDRTFSLQIPSDWIALENAGVFIIGSSQAAITNITSNHPDEEDILVLAISPTAVKDVLDVPDTATTIDIARMLKESVTTDVVLGLTDLAETTLPDGRNALIADAVDGKDLAGRMIVFDNDQGDVASIIIASTMDTLTMNDAQITAILYSLSFDVPEITHMAHAELAWVKSEAIDHLTGNMAVHNDIVYVADGLGGIRTYSLHGDHGEHLIIDHNKFRAATDITIAPDGTLWIADGVSQHIWQASLDGEVMQSFGESGMFAGFTPNFVGVDNDGHVFTNSSPDNGDQLLVYDVENESLKAIMVSDSGSFVWGYTMGKDGHIYINNPLIGIQVYDHDGNQVIERFAPTYTGLQFISAFEQLSDGSFIMAAHGQGTGTIFTYLDPDGHLLTQFTTVDLGLEVSYTVMGFAELPDGKILVADSNFEGAQLYAIEIVPMESGG